MATARSDATPLSPGLTTRSLRHDERRPGRPHLGGGGGQELAQPARPPPARHRGATVRDTAAAPERPVLRGPPPELAAPEPHPGRQPHPGQPVQEAPLADAGPHLLPTAPA